MPKSNNKVPVKNKKSMKYRRRSVSGELILQTLLVVGLVFLIYQAANYLLGQEENTLYPPMASLPAVGQELTAVQPIQASPTAYDRPSATQAQSTLAPLPTLTPSGKYRKPAASYIPDVSDYLSGYSITNEKAIDMPRLEGTGYMREYQNDYPLYHASDDAFSLIYSVYVFNDNNDSYLKFNSFDSKSIVSMYEDTYKQVIYPQQIEKQIADIEGIKIFCFDFIGITDPEIHCSAMLRDGNLVEQVTIKLFDLGASETNAISQVVYFLNLIVEVLR